MQNQGRPLVKVATQPANRERGEVALRALGNTYVLKMTTNAICQMESEGGRSFDQVIGGMQGFGSRSDMRLFIWAMLLHHQPDLTLQDVGLIQDDFGFGKAGTEKLKAVIDDLIALNTQEARGSGTENPPEAQPGTGVSSTSTLAAVV